MIVLLRRVFGDFMQRVFTPRDLLADIVADDFVDDPADGGREDARKPDDPRSRSSPEDETPLGIGA